MDDLTSRLRFELEASYLGARNMSGLERDIQHIADRWNQGLKGKMQLGTDVGMGIGAAGLGVGAYALKQAVDVESAANRMKATYGVSKGDFANYSKFIEDNSVHLLQSQKDLWSGMGDIVAAGFTGKVATQIETGASKIATIFNVTLPDAIKPATIAMKDFHLTAGRTFDLLGKAASQVPGGWAALMSGPVEKVMGMASQSGIGMDSLLAADVTLARKTGGGRAMGVLGQIIAHITSLPGGSSDLANHGLQGTIQHLLSMYAGDPKDLSKVFGGSSNIQYAQLLAGGPGSLGKSSGYTNTAFGQISKDIPEQWKGLKLEMEDVAVNIGKVLIPDLKDFMGWITPIAKGISDWTSKNADLAGFLVKVAVGIGGVSLALRASMFIFNPLKDAVGLFTGKASAAKQATQDLANVTSDLASNKMPAMKQAEQNVGTVVQDMSANKLPALQTATQQTASHIEDLYGNRLPILNTEMQTVGTTAVTTATKSLPTLDGAMATTGADAEAAGTKVGILSSAFATLAGKMGIMIGVILLVEQMSSQLDAIGLWIQDKLQMLKGLPLVGGLFSAAGDAFQWSGLSVPSGGSSGKTPKFTDATSLVGLGGGAPASVVNSYPQVGQYWPMIQAAAKQYGLDPYVLASLMAQESSGNINANATWNKGEQAWDYGLFQYGPPEAASVGGQYGPHVSAQGQIFTAAAYLAKVGLNSWNGSAEAQSVINRAMGWEGSKAGYITGTGGLPSAGSGGGYQSSLPPPSASGTDHTGQPGWILDASGKWKYIPQPHSGQQHYTWTGSSWVPTQTYLQEQSLGRAITGESAQASAISRVWAGINPLNLPATGNHGVNQQQWLKDQYKYAELSRELNDQRAHLDYLLGKLTYGQWQQIKAIDAMGLNTQDQRIWQRLHPGTGGAATHVVPVKITDRCKEEADANVHRTKAANAAEKTHGEVAKSGHAIVTAVNAVHKAIADLQKQLQHQGIGEGNHVPVGGGGGVEPYHSA